MAKLTGFNRKRIGHRNYLATFSEPVVALDGFGQTNYESGTYTTLLTNWACELVDVNGGEVVYGMMATSKTDMLLIGDKPDFAAANINTKCKVEVNGKEYQILAIRDVSGDNRTVRVEVRQIEARQ